MLVSPEQLLPVQHTGHSIIVAVPGSGKTRTLIAKAVAMVQAGYSNIGIVSFTNASAKELKERLEKELSASQVEAHVKIATFHSMMLNHIRQHVVGTGLVSTHYETTHMLSVLGQHQIPAHRLEDFKQYFNLTDSERNEEHSLFPPWQQYVNEVMDKQHITLSNVVTTGTDMIINGRIPPLPFNYLFVDEFQDSDTEQIKLLLVHGLSGVNIVCVGDDDQSIYGWRNARGVEAFWAMQNKLGAQEFILSTNYRSHEEITELANEVITRNKQRIDKTIVSHKGSGGCVTLTLYKTSYDESEYVCQRIAELIEAGHTGDISIIARSNAALDFARELLTVPFHDMANKGNEPYESQIIKTGLNALAQNNAQELATMLSIYLPNKHAHSVASTVCGTRGQQSSMFEHVQPLQHIKRLMGKNQHDNAIREFVAYALPHMLETCETKKGNQQSITKSKARMQRTISKTQEILLKLTGTIKQRLEILSRQRKETSDAKVKLMSVHGSKGLEAETVFLIGVSHKKFPAEKAESEARMRGSKYVKQLLEEERRLLYVGVTRAMTNLHISAFSGTSARPDAHGYSKLIPPSYIDELPSLFKR